MNNWSLNGRRSQHEQSLRMPRDRYYLFEEVPVTPVTKSPPQEQTKNPIPSTAHTSGNGGEDNPANLSGGAPSSLNSRIRLLASQYREPTQKGSVYSTYLKRPGGYVQLRNDAIDQGRQKYKQSVQYQSTALNNTLQQRSRTQVPLIFTGARPTLCHNKKRVHRASRSGSQVAEQTHVRYKWET
jgi:hypothetical protein